METELTGEHFSEGETGRRAAQRLNYVLTVNGDRLTVCAQAPKTLLEVLREDLELTGTKHGCELGECGLCTVLVEGRPILSCLTLAAEMQGKQVTTVEGIANGAALTPLQEEFANLGASQCGYCTPGMILSAGALLEREPNPTRSAVCAGLSGNLCRCTGYEKIIGAVLATAERLRNAKSGDGTV